jgi:hypothetical protein
MGTETKSPVLEQKLFTAALPRYEEVHQLREINQEQYRMIRKLEGQSLLWESVAETRAENLQPARTLGLDPDVNDEEQQL